MRGNYDKYKEDISAARAMDRYFSNVINLGEPHKGVLVWAYGKLVYKQIKSIQDSGDYGDITDEENGTDLTLVRTGTGRQIQDTIYPVRQPSRLVNPAWIEEMFDLDAIFKEPDLDAITDAFKTHTWKVWEGERKKVTPKVEEVKPTPQPGQIIAGNAVPEQIQGTVVVEENRLEKLASLEAKLRKTAGM
jgi:hypothetical protein